MYQILERLQADPKSLKKTRNMQQQQTASTLRFLKLCAIHYLANILIAIAGIIIVITGVINNDGDWIWAGTALLASLVISIFLFYAMVFRRQCPLCFGKIWVRTGCRRHRNAPRALGISYRLHLASSLVFSDHYHCPYCGDSFSTKAKRD